MHVSCIDVPRAQGHIEDIKLKFAEGSNAYRVVVLGEFPTADLKCFAWDSLQAENDPMRPMPPMPSRSIALYSRDFAG